MDVTTEQRDIAMSFVTMGIPFSPEHTRVTAPRTVSTRQIIGVFLPDIEKQIDVRFRTDTFNGKLLKRSENGFIDATPSRNVGRLGTWEVPCHIKNTQKSGQCAILDAVGLWRGIFRRLNQERGDLVFKQWIDVGHSFDSFARRQRTARASYFSFWDSVLL